ncbi:MAG: DeoR/GlpR family DNA-binding transcription regulator [Sphaerochaetaceae bacterium]|nr:DeoR/GlpR family DNA-binding transcription regulator [Sphaerochaetaceae bacterium]
MEKKEKRINAILNLLKEQRKITIKECAKNIKVSEMTIRRDLMLIQSNNIASLNNGLITYNPNNKGIIFQNYNLRVEKNVRSEEKNAIGKFAASLVEPNDTIIFDTGTTTVHIARNLPPDINLTALCFNTNVLLELCRNPNISLLFAGGFYHKNAQMFESKHGIEFIRELRANKVFVSAAGIHSQMGLTCSNNYEIETKKAIIASALERILVTDSSKFGQIRSSFFCNLSEINTIVTDSNLSKEWVNLIHEKNIKLYQVPCENNL